MARELSIEEMKDVSGSIPPQTDWAEDYKGGDGSIGFYAPFTGIRNEDSDYRKDY